MFKKIFFLFMCFFLLYIGLASINVFAYEIEADIIYIETGTDIDSVINLDNAVIIANNVNNNLEGEYEITYFDNITKTYFKKKVIVVKDGAYLEGITKLEKTKKLSYDEAENAKATHVLEVDNKMVVCGYRVDNKKENHLDGKKAFINFFDNGIKKKTVTYDYYSEIIKVLPSKNGFLVLANFEDYEGKIHLFIEEYTIDGYLIRDYTLIGNNEEVGKNLFLDEEFIYLILTTSSSNIIKSLYDAASTIGVVKMNYQTFKIQNYYVFGNDHDNLVLASSFDKDNLYIVFRPFGGGTFSKKKSGSVLLIKINKDLEMVKYIELGIDSSKISVSILNNNLYIFSLEEINALRFIKWSLDLNDLENGQMILPFEEYIASKIISSNDNNLALVISGKNSYYEANYLLGVVSLFGEDLYFQEAIIDHLEIASINSKTNTIYGFNHNQLNVFRYTKFIEKDDNFYVNGEALDGVIIYDSYEEENIYGASRKLICIRDGNSCFLKEINYYAPLNSSVADKETYEKGIEICANGRMQLNNKIIENGYIVCDNGDYLLKIYGKNEEITYIQFSVNELVNEAINEANTSNYEINITNLELEDIDNTPLTINNIEKTEEVTNGENEESIGVGIIIIAFMIIGAFLFPVKRKKVGKNG